MTDRHPSVPAEPPVWNQPPAQPEYGPGFEPSDRILYGPQYEPVVRELESHGFEPSNQTLDGQGGAQVRRPRAEVRLHLKAGLFSKGSTTPKVRIDGIPVATRWGDNVIPVAAGRHRIQVSTQYLYEMGQMAIDVDADPAATPDVYYAASSGGALFPAAIGITPQASHGGRLQIAVLVFFSALLLTLWIASTAWG